MSNEPKTCPFCKSEASWIAAQQMEDGAYYPAACGCRKCGIWRYGERDYGHGGFATEEDRKVSLEQAISKWNTRADDPTCKYDQTDSREQLEADILAYLSPDEIEHRLLGNAIMLWLDRQAAITKDECRKEHRQRLSELHDSLDKAAREREELKRRVEYNGELVEKVKRERNSLQARVDHLTYDAKKWADAANEQRLVAMEQADEAHKLRDKLMDVTNELNTYKKLWESSK